MVYLITFLLCLFADKQREKHKSFYSFIILWVYIFLCFGYMTGSDWRNYELMYDNGYDLDRIIEKGEFGFYWLIKIFKMGVNDFWIFNACMKMFYLYTLIKFFGQFTDYKIMAVGISFCFLTLFMLIDCPMRFMIGLSFSLLSVKYLLARNWKFYILLSILSISFHTSLLIVCLVLILMYFIGPFIVKIPHSVLWLLFILCLIVANTPLVKSTLFSVGEAISFFEGYFDTYGDNREKSFSLLSLLKSMVLGTLMIVCKDRIIEGRHGVFVFSMLYYSLTIGSFLALIPTGFRFNILPSYFQVIALVIIYFTMSFKGILTLKLLTKYSLILLFSFLLVEDVKSPIYTPYSNSIYYILTEHLPYSYRNTHNYIPEK